MEESTAVREAVLDFYRGVSAKAVERFDDIVSAEAATLVIGTAPREWVTERPRLRFGFETEGLTLEPGPTQNTEVRSCSLGRSSLQTSPSPNSKSPATSTEASWV